MYNKVNLRIISWNLASRLRNAKAQVAFLGRHNPDVVALQEVTKRTLPILLKLLVDQGLNNTIDSFALVRNPSHLKGPRRYGEIIASRWPIRNFKKQIFDAPWPERILSGLIMSPYGRIDLHNAHIPVGSNHGWTKISTLEAIYDGRSIKSKQLRVLCGDFNTPQEQKSDGRIITWAQRENGKGEIVFRARRGVRWDRGERRILSDLAKYDLSDVFRYLNGYKVRQFSWISRRQRRRYDHVFASIQLNPVACRYLHGARKRGLSDHSPIEACFQPKIPKVGRVRIDGKKRKPVCPFCGSRIIIPIAYGFPGPDVEEKSKKGKVILGGCMVWENQPQSHCNDCGYEWRGNGAKSKVRKNGKTPFDDFRRISRRFKHKLDEPLSLQLMARLRVAGVLNDEDWSQTLECLRNAMVSVVSERQGSDNRMINIDADPRNQDWLRIVRVYRLAGYRLPSWAAMWLAQISVRHEASAFWRSVEKFASEMPLEKFKK